MLPTSALPATAGVLIVGAGPTGLTMAIELARRGVDAVLVDRRPEPLPWDRATVIHSQTLEILDALGIVETFLDRGHRMDGVTIYAYGKPCASLRFESVDSRYPFDLNLSEHVTEEILSRELERLGGAVQRGWTLIGLDTVGDRCRALLEGADGVSHSLQVDWVIGADGLHSKVRTLTGVAQDGHGYEQLWGVVDCSLRNWRHDRSFGAVQIEPPSVNPLPLPGDRWRIYFRAGAEQSQEQTLASLAGGLDTISPGTTLAEHDKPMVFHTYRQLSRVFRQGRVLLAGDAAHACSPIEGHGMNAGIQDAFNLGWKLALVLQGRADEALIHTYETERRPVVDAFGASGDAAERLRATPGDRSSVERVKRTIMASLSAPRDRYQAALAESELDFRYPASAIVCHGATGDRQDEPSRFGPQPGDRLPDAGPLRGTQGECRLYDLLRHPECVILWLVTDRCQVDAEPRGLAALRSVASLWFLTTADVQGLPGEHWLLDVDGLAHARLGAIDPALFVIRPDNRVGFRSEDLDPAAALAYFQAWRTLP